MPKVIKTVKGKEYEMEAEESQVETLLKDKRFRLAGREDAKNRSKGEASRGVNQADAERE